MRSTCIANGCKEARMTMVSKMTRSAIIGMAAEGGTRAISRYVPGGSGLVDVAPDPVCAQHPPGVVHAVEGIVELEMQFR